jgi:RHS repeat-associated protein
MTANDYYPFGMTMPSRKFDNDKYRYGFNGKENSPEISNGAVSFEARIYDSRIGRFFSADPREAEYAWQSTYVYFRNCPISVLDFLGKGGDEEGKPSGKDDGFRDRRSRKIKRIERKIEKKIFKPVRKFYNDELAKEDGKRGADLEEATQALADKLIKRYSTRTWIERRLKVGKNWLQYFYKGRDNWSHQLFPGSAMNAQGKNYTDDKTGWRLSLNVYLECFVNAQESLKCEAERNEDGSETSMKQIALAENGDNFVVDFNPLAEKNRIEIFGLDAENNKIVYWPLSNWLADPDNDINPEFAVGLAKMVYIVK